MRNCALWISPDVGHNEERIIDTAAAMTDADRELFRRDPNNPPKDTVLVVIHPARHLQMIHRIAQYMVPSFPEAYYQHDVNGRTIATRIVADRCFKDPELARSLRW